MRLGHVADHRQAAAHIAVQRAVAHREFALVAGGQHQRAAFVRERHQGDAAQARLHILFRDVRRAGPSNTGLQHVQKRVVLVLIGIELEPDAQVARPARAHRCTLCSDEYGPGMPTPMTFSLPTASTAMAAVSAESMPPLKPDQHALESRTCGCNRACPAPALDRPPRIRPDSRVLVAGQRLGVDQHQIFGERSGRRDHLAVRHPWRSWCRRRPFDRCRPPGSRTTTGTR